MAKRNEIIRTSYDATVQDAIAVYKSDRTLVAPRVPNYDCSSRTLYPVDVDGVKISADDLLDFSSTPLR